MMPTLPQEVRAQDLKEILVAAGEEDPERALKRLRQDALIPHPTGGGNHWVYPPHTVEQVQAIIRLKQQERRHDYVRFWLWWEGFPIEETALRRTIESLIRPMIDLITSTPGEDPLEQAENITQKFTSGRESTLRRRIRHGLPDPEDQQTFMITFLRMMLGDSVPLTWEDNAVDEPDLAARPLPEILDRGMGLHRARTDWLDNNPPWLPETALETFTFFQEGRWLDLQAILEEIPHLTIEGMNVARGDIQKVLPHLAEVVRGMTSLLGNDALGMGYLGKVDLTDPHLLALLTIHFVRMHRTMDMKWLGKRSELLLPAFRTGQDTVRVIRLLVTTGVVTTTSDCLVSMSLVVAMPMEYYFIRVPLASSQGARENMVDFHLVSIAKE